MHITLSAFFILLVELLSLGDLSSINDDDNQYHAQTTNTIANQIALSTVLSTLSTNIKWIKTLGNITEYRGQTVHLECQVESAYPVSFRWYRYNNPIDRTRFIIDENLFRSSIHLVNLKESHTGFYSCEVSNGWQTLMSTGFVRIKNLDVGPIDQTDDIIPMFEFQPEIVTHNEELIGKLICEPYEGETCRSIVGSNHVSLPTRNQQEIELYLIEHIKYLSKECYQLLLPMICFFVYPICNNNQMASRSICRQSCYRFENNHCMKQLFSRQQTFSNRFRLPYNLPTCDNLPPSSDDASCIKVDEYRNVSSSVKTPPIISHFISSDTQTLFFLRIFIPVSLICLSILFLCCCYRNRTNTNKNLSSFSSPSSLKRKSPYLLNPTSPSSRHVSSTMMKNNHRPMKTSTSTTSTSNTNFTNVLHRQPLLKTESHYQPTYIPSDGNGLRQVPLVNIRFLEEVGEGEYGRVFIGELIDNKSQVIIKTLQNEHLKQDYLQEIEIFRHIHHANISCLVGMCIPSKGSFTLTIYESLNHGNLNEHLILQHSKMINLIDVFFISMQIVSGMIYLSERHILHNDLSTKNILICEHLNIKLTNIGRCNPKYHIDYYAIANHLLPIRWMSIESLLSGIYSEKSDVWSFGILLWEIFSYGTQPYYGHTNPEVIEMIRDRIILSCPLHCPKKFYALMCSCWEEISEHRPTFIELMYRLKHLQEKSPALLSIDDELISINPLESF